MKYLQFIKKLIFQTRWQFFKPKEKDVLIYDHGSEYLFQLIDSSKCFIYDVQFDPVHKGSINFYIIIVNFIKNGLKNFKENYKKTYFHYIKPKFIITFRHYNPSFYKIKNIFKNATTIFIQWGKAQRFFFDFDEDKGIKNQVDYMFTFGESVSEQYSKKIIGKCISVGSIINNNLKLPKDFEKNTLIFISQFKGSHRILPKSEEMILKILKKYCQEKKLKFYINTRALNSDKKAEDIFSKILGEKDWHYFPRKYRGIESDIESYGRVMKSEFVVFLDSTLGYEALSRGKKVVALPLGANIPDWCNKYNVHSYKPFVGHQPPPFGYPLELPDTGPFWTNVYDEKIIIKILNYITNVSDENWNLDCKKYQIEKIIKFDSGNKSLLGLFKELKIPIKEI